MLRPRSLALLALAACSADAPVPLDASAGALTLVDTASTTLTGPGSAGGGFGAAIDVVGDVDGDGYDDVLVGAPDADSTGLALLYPGSASGLSTTAAMELGGETAGSEFGWVVDGIGDVNGDGFVDVAVGAPGYNSSAGKVYVYLGSASGLSGTADFTFQGTASSSRFGYALSGGDTNGDGYDDLVIGAPGYNSGAGRVYVYMGSATGLPALASNTLDGAGGAFGSAVLAHVDVNEDGYTEVFVGSPEYSSSAGRVTNFAGSSSGPRASGATSIEGEASGARFGESLGMVGNLNVDLWGDVFFAAPGYSSGAGRVYVHVGGRTGLSFSALWTMDGASGGGAGTAVAGEADFDLDGLPDLAVGSPDSGAGRVDVFGGDGFTLDTTAGTSLTGTSSGDLFGYALAAADLDHDGGSDLIVGAPGRSSGTGEVRVFPGLGAYDLDGDGYNGRVDCDDGDVNVHPGAREVPSDGRDSNCDGAELCFLDADEDGARSPEEATIESADLDCTDAREADGIAPATDCDDSDPAIGPNATEVPLDGIDQDCDDMDACYADADEDGFADARGTSVGTVDADCDDPGEAGPSDPGGDCDDRDPEVYPGGTETPGDQRDGDCDGTEECWVDADFDGYRSDDDATVISDDADCTDPGEASDEDGAGDCDDADRDVHPGAPETVGDGVDSDCDGSDRPGEPGDTGDTGGDTGDSGGDNGGDNGGNGGDNGGNGGDDDTGDPPKDEGCGCASASPDASPAGLGLLAALGGLVLIRRRRAA